MREIKYSEAIAEAHVETMQRNPNAFILGVGVADATGIFGTTKIPAEHFGTDRVIDTPMSENSLTGICVGAGAVGMYPILVHARNDFLLLTMDQIVNHAAKWRYMSGGKISTPLLIRAIIGRGWGQAAQHSQSLEALLMHIPGLQVVMPVTPADAKGLLLAAQETDVPTICIEHRWLYEKTGDVPEGYYTVPIGKAKIVRGGSDVTVVAVSHMVLEAEEAAKELANEGIDVEVIDLRSVRPLDREAIRSSVLKTKRLVVADTGWLTAGLSSEIVADIAEHCHGTLLSAPIRIGLPDVPTPCTPALETVYYPTGATIADTIRKMMAVEKQETVQSIEPVYQKPFSGPF